MLSTFIYFALMGMSSALAIGQPRSTADQPQPRTVHLQKRLDTGSKIALGICVPVAAFVVGLGVAILMMYPAQLRKLRQQNPGAEIGLNELMTGRIGRRPAPPPYDANDAAAANKLSSETTDPPSYPAPAQTNARPEPTTDVQARHAALMS